jgi:hypothetical protein
VAVVHRMMTVVLLGATRRVWISIPSWECRLRPYTISRKLQFEWLPIPSNIPVADDAAKTKKIRRRYAADNTALIGHFGTYGPPITSMLEPVLLALSEDSAEQSVLLMGRGSNEFRERLIAKRPEVAFLIRATGELSSEDLSYHVAACDLLVQPYPDGVSTRRTSAMLGLSHGKPIATTIGRLSEALWEQTGPAAMAPAGDSKALIDAIRRLRKDKRERGRLGSTAKKLYQDRFDVRHVIAILRGAQKPTDGAARRKIKS